MDENDPEGIGQGQALAIGVGWGRFLLRFVSAVNAQPVCDGYPQIFNTPVAHIQWIYIHQAALKFHFEGCGAYGD